MTKLTVTFHDGKIGKYGIGLVIRIVMPRLSLNGQRMVVHNWDVYF